MLTGNKITTSCSKADDIETTAYTQGRSLPASPHVIGSQLSCGWDGRLAAVISRLGSPPILACTAVALTASKLSSSRAWMWAGIYVLLAVLIPLLYLVWLVRRGDVTDLDVRLRKQRARPLLITIICTGLAWFVLAIGVAPTTMVIVAGALWLQVLAIFAITLRWKISVHAAAAAGATTVAWALLGTPLPFLLTVPLVAWSRVRLRRHTPLQTVAGALLGFAIFFAAAQLIPAV